MGERHHRFFLPLARKGQVVLLTVFVAVSVLGVPGVEARERLGEEKIESVERVAQDSRLEAIAGRRLMRQSYYRKLRADERKARLEYLKLTLQKRRRKRFSQGVSFQTMYDRNYFRAGPKAEQESIVFNVMPATSLNLGGSRWEGGLSYSPAVEVPTRFKENLVTRFYQNLSSNIEIPVGKRTKLRGFYRMFRGVDRGTSETVNFTLRTEHREGDEVEYYVSKKLSAAFAHTFDERHFSETINDRNASREHWFLPSFNYHLSPKTSIFIQGGGGITRGGNGTFDATNSRLSVGIQGRLTSKSSALINLGVTRKKLSEGQNFVARKSYDPFLELVYIFKPGWRYLPEIRLVSNSSHEDSTTAGNPFYLAQNFQTGITQRLSPKIFLLLNVSTQGNAFSAGENPGNNLGERIRRIDHIVTLGYGLRYKVNRNFSIELSHTLGYKTSTVSAQEWSQGIYTLNAALSF